MSAKAAGNGNGSEALLLTVKQAAEVLCISPNLAYELVAQGRLPHICLESRIARQQNLPEPLRQFASAISARVKDDREE
jgi:hypothetical protein